MVESTSLHLKVCIIILKLTTNLSSANEIAGYSKAYENKRKITNDINHILCNFTVNRTVLCLHHCFKTLQCSAVNFNQEARICECLSEATLSVSTFENSNKWRYIEIDNIVSTLGR